ncbi:MAG: apolipoprotein N-acyltransferase [Pleomorphochaeta sp.]
MNRKFYSLPFEIFLTIISAFIYALAFPSFLDNNGFAPFAFFALIPMIYAVNKTKWKYTPLLGFIFGVTFLGIFNYWLSTFHPLAIFIGPIAKGIQLMIFFPLLKVFYKFPRKYKAISQAMAYVIYSYIVQKGFLAYSYGSLASSTINLPIIAQLSSLTGMWGISFLLFLPQSYIAIYLLDSSKGIRFSTYLYKNKYSVSLYAFIMFCVCLYGVYTINYWRYKKPDDYVKIATVQHNADTWEGGYSRYKSNFDTLSQLTLDAMKLDPDLVMWSETAFVPSVAWHTQYPSSQRTSKLVDEFVEFGKELNVPLITGNVEGVLKENGEEPFLEDGSWNRDDYNTIILFSDGELKDTYRKQHLVPFTEYFPYGDIFPRFYNFLKSNDYKWWLPSDISKTFSYNNINFSTSICFEDIFSDISRNFVNNGSNLLLNLSNDSWSKSIAAEQQHMYLGAFRAIENRKSVVRSTNSGITCLITAWGEIIEPIEPFTTNYRVYNVPIYYNTDQNLSVYTKYGDYFVYTIFIIIVQTVLFRIIYSIFNKKKKTTPSNAIKKRINYTKRNYTKDKGLKKIPKNK